MNFENFEREVIRLNAAKSLVKVINQSVYEIEKSDLDNCLYLLENLLSDATEKFDDIIDDFYESNLSTSKYVAPENTDLEDVIHSWVKS